MDNFGSRFTEKNETRKFGLNVTDKNDTTAWKMQSLLDHFLELFGSKNEGSNGTRRLPSSRNITDDESIFHLNFGANLKSTSDLNNFLLDNLNDFLSGNSSNLNLTLHVLDAGGSLRHFDFQNLIRKYFGEFNQSSSGDQGSNEASQTEEPNTTFSPKGEVFVTSGIPYSAHEAFADQHPSNFSPSDQNVTESGIHYTAQKAFTDQHLSNFSPSDQNVTESGTSVTEVPTKSHRNDSKIASSSLPTTIAIILEFKFGAKNENEQEQKKLYFIVYCGGGGVGMTTRDQYYKTIFAITELP